MMPKNNPPTADASPPRIAQRGPYAIKVKAGETYCWCTCGLSETQPFCDGSHKGTGWKSLHFTPDRDETLYLCGCKQTGTPPFCNGSHDSITENECVRKTKHRGT